MKMYLIHRHIVGFGLCLRQDLENLKSQRPGPLRHLSLANDLPDLRHPPVFVMVRVAMAVNMNMAVAMVMAILMTVNVVMAVNMVMTIPLFANPLVSLFPIMVMMAVAASFLLTVVMAVTMGLFPAMVMTMAASLLLVMMMTVAMGLFPVMAMAVTMGLFPVMVMAMIMTMKILHVMIMVLMLRIQDHIKIACVDPRLGHSLNLDLKSLNRKALQCLPHDILISPKVKKGRDCHVPADS